MIRTTARIKTRVKAMSRVGARAMTRIRTNNHDQEKKRGLRKRP